MWKVIWPEGDITLVTRRESQQQSGKHTMEDQDPGGGD